MRLRDGSQQQHRSLVGAEAEEAEPVSQAEAERLADRVITDFNARAKMKGAAHAIVACNRMKSIIARLIAADEAAAATREAERVVDPQAEAEAVAEGGKRNFILQQEEAQARQGQGPQEAQDEQSEHGEEEAGPGAGAEPEPAGEPQPAGEPAPE
eukprot:SAG22_NODE_7811_length_706_cov_0.586491_1_plen_154_part_10